MNTIGFIGSGNMAEALIKGIIAAKVYDPDSVFISDVLPDRIDHLVSRYGVQRAQDNAALASTADVIVLSVKPQMLESVLGEIKDTIGTRSLVITIAAGKKIESVTSILGDIPVIRIMPNTPALVLAGASALYPNSRAKAYLDKAMAIFSAVGKAVVVDSESLIDAVTAVSGSGPAYFFLLMEEMIKAAVDLGLDPVVAKDLVLQTALGSATLAKDADKRNESPADLRRKVTSPKGTTQAAIEEFERLNFGPTVREGIKKAFARSIELSK